MMVFRARLEVEEGLSIWYGNVCLKQPNIIHIASESFQV